MGRDVRERLHQRGAPRRVGHGSTRDLYAQARGCRAGANLVEGGLSDSALGGVQQPVVGLGLAVGEVAVEQEGTGADSLHADRCDG